MSTRPLLVVGASLLALSGALGCGLLDATLGVSPPLALDTECDLGDVCSCKGDGCECDVDDFVCRCLAEQCTVDSGASLASCTGDSCACEAEFCSSDDEGSFVRAGDEDAVCRGDDCACDANECVCPEGECLCGLDDTDTPADECEREPRD